MSSSQNSSPEFEQSPFEESVNRQAINNTALDEEKAISSEPQPTNEMSLSQAKDEADNNSSISSSSSDNDDAASGYERESNECTEFCIECCNCFGLFSGCCPNDSEGCITTVATFFGNILFACCKC
ncbi:putative suppressor of mutant AC40 subunit of RNA polymerase I and III (high serine) [Scheffersomyces stipitis CBS 6054]|uniref:Hypothetical suppressor of mutant AC40 subunit of RNA polymerase I and III (High serine) n=1 Tax=Scheffersomyces stipitis (strain ATCC 58785 / CBS 6054 / NBRC 10063 / NRRL Y-11545) TaxID=322104 RepID=A3GGC9_PICST|nr:Hypothetical suppressor of mutant AC40 subunit of RNA polymerase I and III (high serine) [Scheffersomyces stipitis CBS 6054]EAZ63912.1 putative suppressor of mutant AC40 subunit of RNA polymerase I and III (high serine) [Scheffersomyces stipitis CBS 6054]KAG2735164.1 hypothetical protein G9P44_001378 [Scheffersomyces stipitis]